MKHKLSNILAVLLLAFCHATYAENGNTQTADVKVIDKNWVSAHFDCGKDTETTIPEGVDSIGSGAFSFCKCPYAWKKDVSNIGNVKIEYY
ncbi:MAG: hypothetical protein MJZ34_01695 [Paludibacteraceae bacterium]|nr:hypothetical protein [Paludibacteraceae bacterium]